jgi:hypothetical protein
MRHFFLATIALLGCSGPDLPPGWEDAERIEGLTQTECAGSPYGDGPDETLTATGKAGAVSIAYDAAHFRCEQQVEGFARTTAHSVSVLVQPIDMNPSAVAGCDCLYDIRMTVGGLDQGAASVELYRRWDNANTHNDPVKIGAASVDVP